MILKIKNIFISLVLFLFITVLCQDHYAQDIDPVFSSENLKAHVNYLGSDELQGRGTGTPGELLAANYIADHLKKYNLKIPGNNNNFFQLIPMHGSIPLEKSQLLLVTSEKEILLELNNDYLLYKTGAQTYIPNPLPIVFVGYGIIAPEYDYNDYQSVDINNKIVVFLSGEPRSQDKGYFNGEKPTIYSAPEAKHRIAISRGAQGSIMIPNPYSENYIKWDKLKKEFAFEDVTLAYTVSANLSILLNPDSAEKLFLKSPYSFKQILEMDNSGTIHSFDLKSKIAFDGKFLEREFLARNILAQIQGSDEVLKDTYIILTAHYDHLGIGPPVHGDSVYNGVYDNALGVAALLELARIFAQLPLKPSRSLLFAFFTGEEKGLLGSSYYTDNPVVPLYKSVLNINIDGIAVFDEFNDVICVGLEYLNIEDEFIDILRNMGLNLSTLPRQYFLESESINRSDQFSFAKAGVPALLIVEGLNYKNTPYQRGVERIINWNKNIYHTPFDDLGQKMNFEAALQHIHIIYEITKAMANSTRVPAWKPSTPFVNARLQSIAEKR